MLHGGRPDGRGGRRREEAPDRIAVVVLEQAEEADGRDPFVLVRLRIDGDLPRRGRQALGGRIARSRNLGPRAVSVGDDGELPGPVSTAPRLGRLPEEAGVGRLVLRGTDQGSQGGGELRWRSRFVLLVEHGFNNGWQVLLVQAAHDRRHQETSWDASARSAAFAARGCPRHQCTRPEPHAASGSFAAATAGPVAGSSREFFGPPDGHPANPRSRPSSMCGAGPGYEPSQSTARTRTASRESATTAIRGRMI